MDLSNMFKSAPPKIQPVQVQVVVESAEPVVNEPKIMTAEEVAARDRRTLFVGNVSLKSDKRELGKMFKKFGKIEKIWERNVPVDIDSKAPIKAKVIKHNFTSNAINKNCYLLFETEDIALKAAEESKDITLDGRHLVVSVADIKEKDFKTTVFVGNIHWGVDEEKLREFFTQFGLVENVRLVRDRITHQHKGFCYVRFAGKEGFLNALQKNGVEMGGRELRINKAVKNPVGFFDFKNKSTIGVEKAIKKLRHGEKPGNRKDTRAQKRAEGKKEEE